MSLSRRIRRDLDRAQRKAERTRERGNQRSLGAVAGHPCLVCQEPSTRRGFYRAHGRIKDILAELGMSDRAPVIASCERCAGDIAMIDAVILDRLLEMAADAGISVPEEDTDATT